MKALITVGTDEGDWAPPKPVELGVTAEGRTGLGVTNRTEVRWQAEGRGRVTRAAISLGTGDWALRHWARLDLDGITQVTAGQDIVLAPGVLTIDIDLPLLTGPEQRQLQANPALLCKSYPDRE
jgi:hypothetical protein